MGKIGSTDIAYHYIGNTLFTKVYRGSSVIFDAFSPTDISGLQLWLDANDSETITLNGSTVSQWDDKSGNDYHVTQSTASYQPTYSTAQLNGKNVVTFDGIDDHILNDSVALSLIHI